MVQLLEKRQTNIDELIKTCPVFEKCNRLDTMFDRDVLEFQLADGIRTICRKCLAERMIMVRK